jgi:hypothetical protein
VYERVGPNSTVHVFKHALVQDVAYESLLHDRRRELHARVLSAIEHLYAARLDEQLDHLARHALCAENWDKAVANGRQAGMRATGRSAFHEGAQHYHEALQAITHLPAGRASLQQAIDIRFLLRTPLWVLGRFDDVLRSLATVRRPLESWGTLAGWDVRPCCCGICSGSPDNMKSGDGCSPMSRRLPTRLMTRSCSSMRLYSSAS